MPANLMVPALQNMQQQALEMLRMQGVRFLIDLQVGDAIRATAEALTASGAESVEDVRSHPRPLACFSDEMTRLRGELQRLLFDRLYRHYRVVRMAEKARRFLKELFNQYLSNVDQLPPRYRARIDHEDSHQVICDYIAGMTDRFAQDEHRRLFLPFERT